MGTIYWSEAIVLNGTNYDVKGIPSDGCFAAYESAGIKFLVFGSYTAATQRIERIPRNSGTSLVWEAMPTYDSVWNCYIINSSFFPAVDGMSASFVGYSFADEGFQDSNTATAAIVTALNEGPPAITVPITYRFTNCTAPSAPSEAAVGDTVTVPLTFIDGYGVINPSTDAYVTCNGVVVPSTYANGVLTFTMPDPS